MIKTAAKQFARRGAYKSDKEFYPAEWFDETEEVIFEGERFAALKSWDSYLGRNYGNYMELPPPEERKTAQKANRIKLRRAN